MSLELHLLLAEHGAELVDQGWAFLPRECFLRTSCLVVLTLAIHGPEIRPVFIPNLVHEVLFFERHEKLLLLARVDVVQSLLKRIRPVVVRGDVVLVAFLSILLELLEYSLVVVLEGRVAVHKARVYHIVLDVSFIDVLVHATSAVVDLVHDS